MVVTRRYSSGTSPKKPPLTTTANSTVALPKTSRTMRDELNCALSLADADAVMQRCVRPDCGAERKGNMAGLLLPRGREHLLPGPSTSFELGEARVRVSASAAGILMATHPPRNDPDLTPGKLPLPP